jgi:hypothetical protein
VPCAFFPGVSNVDDACGVGGFIHTIHTAHRNAVMQRAKDHGFANTFAGIAHRSLHGYQVSIEKK